MDDRNRPSFFEELKRRRVMRVAFGYAAVAFVALQAADLAVNAQLLSERAFSQLAIAAIVLFPIVLVLGWIFDLTPEGVRLSGRAGGRLLTARVKPWLVYSTGAALLGVLALAVVLRPTSAQSEEVARGAEVIAVLPFTTSGERMDMLAEGMSDLLSRNLDQVGAIRTIDPRTVLYRWERRKRDGVLPPGEEFALGEEVGAGSVLTGSVVAGGSEARINARLQAIDGRTLATAEVTGAADSVLTLVDSLSVVLLREVWRSSVQHPDFDVGAITSGDLNAIRAFLEGERHYRASRWDDALSAFARAVATDALFPLAHYRLATTAGWATTAASAGIGRRSAEFALDYADRLPARERTLVIAQGLRTAGDLAGAADTLRAHLRRYEDDAEAWFALADIEHHLHVTTAGPTIPAWDEQLRTFDRALELDPTFLPAILHPLEIAFLSGEPDRVERYVRLLENNRVADPAGVALYRTAADALRSPRDGEGIGAALALVAAAADTADGDLVRQAAVAVAPPLLRAAAELPSAGRRDVLDRLRERARGIGAAADGVANPQRMVAHILIAGGRLDEARAAIEGDGSLFGGRRWAAALEWKPTLAGLLGEPRPFPGGGPTGDPSGAGRPGGTRPSFVPLAAALVVAVDDDDAAAARDAASRLRTLAASPDADTATAGTARRLADVGDGFARVLDGAGVEALDALEELLADATVAGGDVATALWSRWLGLLAENARTRSRAIELARRPWSADPAFEPLRWITLARALDAEGEDDEARAAYARVASLLAEADAGSRAAALAAEARRTVQAPVSTS